MRANDFINENIQLLHEPTSTGGVEIHAYRDGKEVGWVRFSKLKTGQVKAAMVHVPERLRRQGIGTAMYQYARQELGLDIVPSDTQTEHGQAFWNRMHEAGGVVENFADGRNPQDRGDSARHGIAKKSSLGSLDKIVRSKTASPRKKQLAHWQANMRRGRAKKS